MITFVQVATDTHKEHVRELFMEYMEFVRQNAVQLFDIDFEIAPIVARDMDELDKLSPPYGRLLMVEVEEHIAGLGGLRQIGAGIGEVKRMYIRPAFQGRGLGRALLEALIAEARQIGFQKLRLDVGPHSKSAEKLYRSVGFQNIDPYPESEAPPDIYEQWQFMELSLL